MPLLLFPAMGLGVIVSKARKVTQGMFMAAARTLAGQVDDDLLATGALSPPMAEVRDVSHRLAHAIAEQAVAEEVADPIVDVEARIGQTMWYPAYLPYRPA